MITNKKNLWLLCLSSIILHHSVFTQLRGEPDGNWLKKGNYSTYLITKIGDTLWCETVVPVLKQFVLKRGEKNSITIAQKDIAFLYSGEKSDNSNLQNFYRKHSPPIIYPNIVVTISNDTFPATFLEFWGKNVMISNPGRKNVFIKKDSVMAVKHYIGIVAGKPCYQASRSQGAKKVRGYRMDHLFLNREILFDSIRIVAEFIEMTYRDWKATSSTFSRVGFGYSNTTKGTTQGYVLVANGRYGTNYYVRKFGYFNIYYSKNNEALKKINNKETWAILRKSIAPQCQGLANALENTSGEMDDYFAEFADIYNYYCFDPKLTPSSKDGFHIQIP